MKQELLVWQCGSQITHHIFLQNFSPWYTTTVAKICILNFTNLMSQNQKRSLSLSMKWECSIGHSCSLKMKIQTTWIYSDVYAMRNRLPTWQSTVEMEACPGDHWEQTLKTPNPICISNYSFFLQKSLTPRVSTRKPKQVGCQVETVLSLAAGPAVYKIRSQPKPLNILINQLSNNQQQSKKRCHKSLFQDRHRMCLFT